MIRLSKKTSDRLKSAATFVLVVVFLTGFVQYLRQSLFVVRQVDIQFSSDSQIGFSSSVLKGVEQKLAIYKGKSTFALPIRSVVDSILEDKRISHAQVSRTMLGDMRVKLALRRPIALYLDEAGKAFPLSFDGEFLPKVGMEELPDLPILRGRKFQKELALRKDVLGFLGQLPDFGPFSLASVSEVRFDEKNGFRFWVSEQQGAIQFGSQLSDQKIRRVTQVLDYLHSRRLQTRVIDTRYDKKVVVKLRNGS